MWTGEKNYPSKLSPQWVPGSQEFGAAATAQTGHEAKKEHDIAMEHLNASVSVW